MRKLLVFSFFLSFLAAYAQAKGASRMAALPAPDLPVLAAQAGQPGVVLLDLSGKPATSITDGDAVRLQVDLADNLDQATPVAFHLDPDGVNVAGCTIPAGKSSCQSAQVAGLGWYWDANAAAHPNRTLVAEAGGSEIARSGPIQVAARPVVMVHGFSSDYTAWTNYLGPDGFLAAQGIRGFAAGDGQVQGTLNAGNLTNPLGRTNTIAQNAAILRDYIQNVRQLTGAQQVDLLVHSMGGMIARYYIDRLMQGRDVSQLLILGSPAAGTGCASLPVSLGYYLPAALEIIPSYGLQIFDSQITHRHGVPFFALAGVPIQESFKAPCTGVPTDLAVSEESVSAIPVHLSEMPVLHMELNTSREVFRQFVLPRLQTPAGQFIDDPDPPAPGGPPELLQFTRVFTGHVAVDSSQELTIQIDAGVSVASFALFDPTHSLTVTVSGASGNTIQLNPAANGLVVVDDPSSLVYLGYGFNNPKPGQWKVLLAPTAKTPPTGADFALTARFEGGAQLVAASSVLLPQVNETVQLSAELSLNGQALALEDVQATIRAPDGSVEKLALEGSATQPLADWKPEMPGLYGIDILVHAQSPDGSPLERSAYLAVEAQPAQNLSKARLTLAVIAGLLVFFIVLLFAGFALLVRRLRRSGRRAG